MDEVEIDGLRIAYERAGHGPPLLLVHGFVGDGRSTWSGQLAALSDEFTVVAWDAPGAGHSSPAPESFRLPDYASCLAGFVRALGLHRPHLAGLSFGGAMLLELFRRHPTVPGTLVLVSAYAGWAGSLGPEEADRRLRLSLRLSELPPEEFADALLPSMFSGSRPTPAITRFADSLRDVDPSGFRTMAHASAEADLRDVLPRVDVPTLLLFGEADVRAPREVADALHAAIPGSQLVVLPGVGHAAPVEAPDRVTHEIRRFLTSAAPGMR